MAESEIPVDLLNPGQVFACLGIVEAAEILLGDARGAFDWSDELSPRFRVRAAGDVRPVREVLRFLAEAEAVGQAVAGSRCFGTKKDKGKDVWNSAWGPLEAVPRAAGYPFGDPSSPATVRCVLRRDADEIAIDYWGDETRRDNVKFWAGAGGYPGSKLARDALELIASCVLDFEADPFSLGVQQSSSFRFDWRRDYIPLDIGYSLNKHDDLATLGYPVVELLAAIGLSHARPSRIHKLEYVYGIVGRSPHKDPGCLEPRFLRAALGAAALPFPRRRFRMLLAYPGKKGQARAITTVYEQGIE